MLDIVSNLPTLIEPLSCENVLDLRSAHEVRT
jgi:hypothetical protein